MLAVVEIIEPLSSFATCLCARAVVLRGVVVLDIALLMEEFVRRLDQQQAWCGKRTRVYRGSLVQVTS